MTRYRMTVHPTPIGPVRIVLADDRLLALDVLDGPDDPRGWEALVRELGAVPDDDAAAAASVTAELDAYFAGDLREFTVPVDLSLVRGFTRTALEAVRTIPYGETAAYGEVAAMAGSPRASRAVGTACATTPISLIVPVHRVIRADGSIGPYGGHPEVKRFLLELEDVPGV